QGIVREMLGQPGFENAPGMNRESTHTVFLATSVKFDCEQDVGRLGLTIGRPRIVGTALKIDVVEHDGRKTMPPPRKRHDASALRLLQGRPKLSRELEMAEMVGGELKFMTSAVAAKLGHRHDAGTCDQDMEEQSSLQESVHKSRNRT